MQFDKDLESEHRELFLAARELLLSYEGVVETKKKRITTYSNVKGGICHMRTMPYGIDFGFLKGARMEDKYEKLRGNGKVIRVLSQKGALEEEMIRYYLKQALDLNEK
ncbi:MAG: DUF1801 domain-containing protein [Bacteroidota bacterium]